LIADGQNSVKTEKGVFCAGCFDRLKQQLKQAVAAQSADIDYPRALVGALAGGVGGALVWWAFTVTTHIAFGLVAVLIGFAVGRGVLIMTDGKRSQGLQILAVTVAVLSFGFGTYLVNRSLIIEQLARNGREIVLPLVPSSLQMLVTVTTAGFRAFDLIFLFIVVNRAWRMPAPVRLRE
jgi:hypothetical protein